MSTASAGTVAVPTISVCEPSKSHIRVTASSLVLAATLVATSLIFGLPHLMIPRLLGSDQTYTPFAVSGISSVTYDETATYAAAANYTALRLAPPYDTDLWETRNVVVPTTTAPYFALAALNVLTGGLDNAFIVCDFVLPPTAVLLLYLLLLDIAGSRSIALAGSLATILISFGPRNFLGVPLLLLSQHGSSIVQPLEFSRLLHPELSFTLLAAALLLLWRTVRWGGRVQAVLGGIVGGLLFYTYVYYFPVWLGACALLLLGRRWLSHRVWKAVLLTNLFTWVVSLPFWISLVGSYDTYNFNIRLARHYSETGHVPPPEKLLYTLAYSLIFAVMAISFFKFGHSTTRTSSRDWRRSVLMFHSCIFVAAIVALNAEIMIGFNLEAMNHYPNRLFQPYLVLTGFALLVGPATNLLSRHIWWSRRTATILARGAVVMLLTLAVTRQTVVSLNVADKHALPVEHKLLFEWLNTHTQLDDVVLTTDRHINDLVPVFTHNLLFVPNGERTSAGDIEVERRFLIAMRLLDRPEDEVHDLLAQDYSHGEQPLGLTYTYFLFVSGNGSYNLGLPEALLAPILADYRQLDLARELSQRRLNYIYVQGVERPTAVPGWNFRWAYGNGYGNIWESNRIPASAGARVSG
jgi:hypothetical protein